MYLSIKNMSNTNKELFKKVAYGTIPNVSYWWLIVISMSLRLLPFIFRTSTLIDLKRICIILSYTALLYTLTKNLHIKGIWIIALGTVLNFIAILLNGCFMPVTPEARYLAGKTLIEMSPDKIILTGSGGIVLPIEQTVMWCLTDIIPVSFIHTVFSLGDIVIFVGILVTCVTLISQTTRNIPVPILDGKVIK